MPKPALSVIIPVYNAAKSIRYIIDTILSQSFSDFEIILVNDGSTDETLKVLRDISKEDRRIRVYTKENGGPSSARNLGLANAHGEFIQFYDADDSPVEESLGTAIRVAINHKSDLVVSGWSIDYHDKSGRIFSSKTLSPDREVIDRMIKQRILRSMGSNGAFYNLWNKLLRADIIKQNNLRFREDLRFGEDVIFSLEYMSFVSRIDIIPDVTYRYQVGSSTSVFSKSSLVPEYRRKNDRAIVKFAGQNPNPEELALLQWVRWRWLMSYWSLIASSSKNFREKRNLISAFNPDKLSTRSLLKTIGIKKYMMANTAKLARVSPITCLLLGWSFAQFKKMVLQTKILTKL